MLRYLSVAALTACLVATTPPADATELTVITAENIEWGLLNPLRGDASPRAADLWGDRTKNGATGMLVKFNQGFSSPPHIHNITYRGVVIDGLLHNDDPSAERLWMPTGSFWTQPAGESHITAAQGETNLIYLEIDSGPYLVKPRKQAFDNGERPINLHSNNIAWINSTELDWVTAKGLYSSYLWGTSDTAHGSLLKLPASFRGILRNTGTVKAIVVSGRMQLDNNATAVNLTPSSFFAAGSPADLVISASEETVIYIHATGRYQVHTTE